LRVHFEEAAADIHLSGLVADTDPVTTKSIIHMDSWPQEIEESKILFIPSTGVGTVYICPNATSLDEVTPGDPNNVVINVGETVSGMTVTTTYYNGEEYYMVSGVNGSGGGEATWIERLDLALSASDILFSNDNPILGENVTISATIHNIGEANADNAFVAFYDGEPETGTIIGWDTIDVPAGGTTDASVIWNAATAGTHEIYVLAQVAGFPLDKNYTNNIAHRTIYVRETIIRGTVTDYNGVPVPDSYILAIGPFTTLTITDINGSYSITRLQTGSYTIRVEPLNPNLMTASTSISITAGQTAILDFTLQAACSIAGNITDVNGKGIPDITVYLSGYETPRYRTDENGYYVIPRLQAGTYTVNVDATGTDYDDARRAVDITLGNTTIADFVLAELSPVVQVTTDPGSDYEPAMTQTADGKVWVVWRSYRSGNSDIWYKTSSDGGATWSAASQTTTDPDYDYSTAMTQTADGKMWVVWYSYRSGNPDIWYVTSSDGGATWSYPSQITTDPDSDYEPAIAQTADGTVWVAWYSYRSGNPDIWYKTSSDGGSTWSDAYQLTTDTGSDYNPAITQTNDGNIWVAWQSYRFGGNGIWCKTSPDGGATWSEAFPIDTGIWGYDPAITQTNDGKIWVVWTSYRSGNYDIWYKTSSDGGATWSEASQFTKFSGWDECPAATALSSGKLAVAWQSDRAVNYDIWYGVIGSIGDINPPPHLDGAENEPVGPEAGETVTVQARASDETGVQDVQLVWWVDGSPQGNLLMYDDGNHDDYGAGDDVYGVHIGPFPLIGTVVEYQIQITDIDNNTVLAPQYPYSFEVIKPFVKTADVLLVSDSHYSNRVIPYYSDALDNLGYAYDVWDGELRGSIDGGTLNQYVDGVVIWSTPDWGYIDYSETQDNLSSYLDNGGKLFMSGQDIGYYIGSSDFYRDYLHAQYVQDDIDLYSLFGVLGDPISDGLYINISGDYGANNQYSPSEIDPLSPAVSIFTYDPNATTALVEPSIPEEGMIPPESEKMLPQREPMARPGETMIPRGSSVERSIGTKSVESSGSGALRVDTGTYKVVYFAFGFEAINSAADRATVMERVLNWLAPIVNYNLTISSTSGGNVTTPGEGTFGPYSPGEVVNLIASAEPNYHFTNWTGDIDTIADMYSRRTTIIMNGDYSITANFAEGAAEVDSEWGKVDTPYREDWTIAPASDIIEAASIPGGSVIYVAGFGYEDNDMNASCGPRLWKSEDSGVTWDDIASKVWDADSLPASFNSSTSYFNYVACALDDPDFMAVAIVTYAADYCNMTQAVVISDDGGDNFYWTRDTADGNSILNCVFDMKISNADSSGKHNIALGGVGTKNGTCPRGLVYRYETGGLVGGGWVDASAYEGWDNTTDSPSQSVTKVVFAPSWLADKTVLAVSHTANNTYLQSGTWGNVKAWNAAAGFEAAVLVVNNPSIWSYVRGAAAGIALPTDYEGRHATTRYIWVYVDNATSGVIYKVQNDAVSQVIQQITGKPWLASLSYLGSIDSGKAIAGLMGNGFGGPTMCGEGVQVYRNDGITDMDICCQHWSDACKPPTGTMLAMVGYVSPNKAYAFVSGDPQNPFGFDESAFSFSLDDGDIWNQLGLVDTYVDYLSDVAKSADCSKTWVVSINTEDGVCGCDSVWLKASWLPEASEYSGAWIRDWCGSLTSSGELNSAQTPEIGLLRVPKETEEALTVYLVDRGTDKVYYDGNKGLGCWEEGTSTVDEISDLAVQDEATIYALGFNADVAVSDDHASAASWSSTMDSKVDNGHTIAVLGEGNVLVGGDDGKVSYSNDDLATFLDGDATFTELNGIGDGRVHVAFDSYFDTNSVVYAAVSNVVVNGSYYETPVNVADNGIYRWVIGESSEWKDLGECAGAATPTETQLGLGPSCDTVEVGYYGIVLSNATGNPETDATTGGVLYATFYDAAGDVTGVARCLNPAQKVAGGEGMWDYFIQDTADNHGQFTLEPSSLKICGCLTPDTNAKLFAIDDDWYYDYFAFGDLEDLNVGRLWMYEDCYAKAGPVLESPADGAGVSCDPHYWWNDAFALKWDRQCDASSYNIQIAYDEDFTELVLDISGKDESTCLENDYEPISSSSPSYVVAEGALGAGSCGTTFYWRVRSADAETGEIIHSPWSEVRSFTVAGEPKYYNLTISSTSGGNVTTPGEGTFTYNASEVVSLVATADSGYQFVNWTGDVGTIGDVDAAFTNITMNGSYSITANFEPILPGIGLNVTPQDTTVGVNGDFSVTIWINDSLEENYDGVGIRLIYNTTYINATSVTDADSFDWVLDPGTINNTWNATHGLVKYDAANTGGPLNVSNPVCTVNFKSNDDTGTSGLEFIYIPADAATSITLAGSDILNWASVVNGTVEVVPGATLQGNVTFVGRGTPPNNKWIENFTVRFYQNDTEMPWSPLNITTNDNGVFTMTGLTPGTYDISIKNSTCLTKLVTNVTLTAGNTTVVDFGTMREGDANGDDKINILDASFLASRFGSSEGDPGWSPNCDFNRDGHINILDASALASNFGQHGDLV